MAKSAGRDLTNGSPMKLICGFLLPLLLGMLFQQFYNMVDTVVVGRFLGVNALAGVGSTGSINFLVIGFCMGVCNGFVIPVAQKYGQRDFDALRRYVANILWVSVACAAVMTLLTTLLCRNILIWMNTDDAFFYEAYNYIFVIFLGIPVVFLYNILSGIIRSLGDSRSPVYFLILSSLLNIVLDLISVTVLKLGVRGPGIATVIAQGVSGLLCLFYVARRFDLVRPRRGEWRPDAGYIRRLCSMGLPMGLQYSVTAIGSIVLQSAVNLLGTVYVASFAAVTKVNQLFFCPFDAMGGTMATYAGQNVGAGKLDRIGRGIRACSVLGIGYAVVGCGILWLWGGEFAHLFLDNADPSQTQAIVENAQQFLSLSSLFYIPLAFVNIVRFTIQGLGFSGMAVFAGAFEMVARCIFGFVLVPAFGYLAVCFASPAAWIAADVFLFPAYFHVMKVLRARAAHTPASMPAHAP